MVLSAKLPKIFNTERTAEKPFGQRCISFYSTIWYAPKTMYDPSQKEVALAFPVPLPLTFHYLWLPWSVCFPYLFALCTNCNVFSSFRLMMRSGNNDTRCLSCVTDIMVRLNSISIARGCGLN